MSQDWESRNQTDYRKHSRNKIEGQFSIRQAHQSL